VLLKLDYSFKMGDPEIKQGLEAIYAGMQNLNNQVQEMKKEQYQTQFSSPHVTQDQVNSFFGQQKGTAGTATPGTIPPVPVGTVKLEPGVKVEPGAPGIRTFTAAGNPVAVTEVGRILTGGVRIEAAPDPQVEELLKMKDQVDAALKGKGVDPNSLKDDPKVGKCAIWPPKVSRAGFKYYVLSDKVTTRKGVFAGWRAAEKAMNKGFGWADIPEGSVVGFSDLEKACGYYYGENSGTWVISISK
jgi:hypothetical protein